jgi:hypothetical protein
MLWDLVFYEVPKLGKILTMAWEKDLPKPWDGFSQAMGWIFPSPGTDLPKPWDGSSPGLGRNLHQYPGHILHTIL